MTNNLLQPSIDFKLVEFTFAQKYKKHNRRIESIT